VHFRGKTGSFVRLFIHLSGFLGAIFFLGGAFQGCFELSRTVCFVDAIFDLRFVPNGLPSVVEKLEVWGE